jgi:hypothetical protein
LLHLSILAHDSAQIVFTQDDFRSGYMVVLGGWDGYIKSVIRYCPLITDSDYPRECNEFDKKVILKMRAPQFKLFIQHLTDSYRTIPQKWKRMAPRHLKLHCNWEDIKAGCK